MVKLIKTMNYIYDGYVDPEWVEKLNNVIDGNILITLSNRKRLSIPSNVTKYIICTVEYLSSGHYVITYIICIVEYPSNEHYIWHCH